MFHQLTHPTTSPAQNIYKTIQQIALPQNFVATSKPKQFLVSFQKGSNSGNDVHPYFFREIP